MARTFLSEPGTHLIHGDYVDEPYGMTCRLVHTLCEMGIAPKRGQRFDAFLRQVEDTTLCQAIALARKSARVRTVEERFLDPNSRQKFEEKHLPELHKELAENPKSVVLLNRLADIINTTDALPEFKKALNAMYRVLRYPKRNRCSKTFLSTLTDPQRPVARIPDTSSIADPSVG